MNTLLSIMAAAALAAAVALFRRRPRLALANIAEGTHEHGAITKYVDAAFATRYLVAKIGTDAAHVDICGVSDIPLGIATDEAAAAEDILNINVLGAVKGTQLVVASAAITAGDLVVPAASGKVKTLPATTGTYYIIGRALQAAAADGDRVEIAPCFPTQRVVA